MVSSSFAIGTTIAILPSGNCDRVAVITTALLQIILLSSTPRSGLRHHVEQLLRDEFNDVKRQAIADRELGDDA
jgi:hypothetical protein